MTDGMQKLEDVSYGTIWILLVDAFAETKAEEFTGAFLLIVISHFKWDPSSFVNQGKHNYTDLSEIELSLYWVLHELKTEQSMMNCSSVHLNLPSQWSSVDNLKMDRLW